MSSNTKGWPMWVRILIPAVVLIGAAIVIPSRFVNGMTRTGVDMFNDLYSGRTPLTEQNTEGNMLKGFQEAAAEHGPVETYQIGDSQNRSDDKRRIHDVGGYIRRRGKWYIETFTITTRRHGADTYSNYLCQPLIAAEPPEPKEGQRFDVEPRESK